MLAVWKGVGGGESEMRRHGNSLQLAGSKDCAKVYNRRDWKSGGARRDLGTLSLATTNAQRNQGRTIDTTHPLLAATHRRRWQTLFYSAGAGFCSVSRDLLCLGRAARHHTHRHLFAVHRSGAPQGTSVAESVLSARAATWVQPVSGAGAEDGRASGSCILHRSFIDGIGAGLQPDGGDDALGRGKLAGFPAGCVVYVEPNHGAV